MGIIILISYHQIVELLLFASAFKRPKSLAIQAFSVGNLPQLQSKTIYASKNTQIVKPDIRYDGLSQVTVNPSDYNLRAFSTQGYKMSDLTYSETTDYNYQLNQLFTFSLDVSDEFLFKYYAPPQLQYILMHSEYFGGSNFTWDISWYCRCYYAPTFFQGGGGFTTYDTTKNNIQVDGTLTLQNNYITKITFTFFVNNSHYNMWKSSFEQYSLALVGVIS